MFLRFFVMHLFVIGFYLAPSACLGLASMAQLTYQGRILKTDGTPLEYNSVSFIFQITNPSGSCVIYQEQVNGYNMANSGGVFDVTIGAGTVQFPTGGGTSIMDVFNNSVGSYNCSDGGTPPANSGSTYSPLVSDGRLLRVSFYDGIGWKLISPDSIIRSVPYAGYSFSAQKLGTNVASDFLTKAGLPTCAAGTFLSWDGGTNTMTCNAVVGASGGTVTNVTSSNSYLTVSNGASTPGLTLNVGTSANTVAAGNDPRLVNAIQNGTTASGDLSGSYPGPTVVALQNVGVSSATPVSGQFLKFNGTNWLPAAILTSDVSGFSTALNAYLTQSAFNGYVSSAGCSTSQTMYWNSVSGNFQCQTIAASATNLSGIVPVANGGTGAATTSQSFVFAGPASGSGAPSFRSIASTDLPNVIGTNDATALTFKTNNSNRLSIDASGNVQVLGATQMNGHLTIGSNASGGTFDFGTLIGSSLPYSAIALSQETTTDATTPVVMGHGISLTFNPSADSGSIMAGSITVAHSQTGNTRAFGGLYGQVAVAEHNGVGIVSDLTSVLGIAITNSTGAVYRSAGGAFVSHSNSSAAVTENAGVRIDPAAGVFTNNYGIKIEGSPATPTTITNQYGLYIVDQHWQGSAKSYNLYSEGTSSTNYFAGKVGIGTETPTKTLDVAGTVKLGTAGTGFTAMGTCTFSAAIPTTEANGICTGVPASTSVIVSCSPMNALSAAAGIVFRATGTANQIAFRATTLVNSTTWNCMWMQP